MHACSFTSSTMLSASRACDFSKLTFMHACETDTVDNLYVDGTVQILAIVPTMTDISFILSPNPADPGELVVLLGNLTESDTGKPIHNTEVNYYVDGTFADYLVTNGSGWFEWSGYVWVPDIYHVHVTYPGNATYNPSSHTETAIVREPTVIYFNFISNPATPGSSVALQGILVDDSSNPISYATVTVEYSTNHEATWHYIWALTTNQYGIFSTTFSAPGTGIYLARVSYAGNSTHVPSSNNAYLIVRSAIYGGETAGPIFFNFILNPATSGTSVTLGGVLLDKFGQPISSAAVTVEYSTNHGATWNYIWTLTTNHYGIFSRTFTAPSTGTYLVRVSYGGSSTYKPSDSNAYLVVL